MADHGTPGRYNAGCSCEKCQVGNTSRHAQARHRRYVLTAEGKCGGVHGRISTYSNWGCNCILCGEAARRRMDVV